MVTDLLARIKNAARARKESVRAPFSRLDFEVAKKLEENGFLSKVEKRVYGKKNFLEITLKYVGREPALRDFQIVSKPSRRLYTGYRELRPVKRGYGMAVLSTPRGVLTDKEAKKYKVGGEELFRVW